MAPPPETDCQPKSSQNSRVAENSRMVEEVSESVGFGNSSNAESTQQSEAPTTSKIFFIVRDPGLRQPMWTYPINERDEVRRAYLKAGPYQMQFDYPEKKKHRFKYSWFADFPWLEYSPTKDAAFCLPCYLFTDKPKAQNGWDAFTVKGFQNWKKVKDGQNCAFLKHMGSDPCSPHNNSVNCCTALLNQSSHIDKAMEKQSKEEVVRNRLRIKTSIDVA